MNTLWVWTIIFGAGIITYALRLSFVLLLGRLNVPEVLIRGLRYVPPAVLSALVLPAFVYQGTELSLTWQNPRLVAGAVAAVVAWRTGNIILTLVVGMAALWAWQWAIL